LIVYKTIIIVSERENIIVERLGKYQRTLTPGIYFLIPFIDFAAYKQEMREQVIDIHLKVLLRRTIFKLK